MKIREDGSEIDGSEKDFVINTAAFRQWRKDRRVLSTKSPPTGSCTVLYVSA